MSKFLAVRQHCPTVKHIIRVGDGTRSQDVSSLYAALEDIETHARFDSLYQEWSSPAMIYFTSGTSGHPKMVRHNQIMLSLGKVPSTSHLGKLLNRVARGIAFGQWYQLAPGKVLWNTADQGLSNRSPEKFRTTSLTRWQVGQRLHGLSSELGTLAQRSSCTMIVERSVQSAPWIYCAGTR